MARDALALERARAAHPEERVLQSELLFGDAAGEILIVGEPPAGVLLAAGVATTDLTLVGRGRQVREARRWIEALTPCAVTVAEREGGGLPRLEGTFGAALVWDLPPKDPIEVLERALFSVADGGRLLVSVGRRGAADARIERLVASLAGGAVQTLPGAAVDRLSLVATRRAPYPGEAFDEAPEPLPITAVVRHSKEPERTERLLVDLLLRQVWPPARVLVLDDAERIADQLPEDLWGLAERAPCELALVTEGGGRSLPEALNDALGAIETPFVVFFEGGERIAPAHLVTLGMHLERSAASVVVADALTGLAPGAIPRAWPAPHRDGERLLRALLDGGRPCLGAALWRVDRLRERQGFDPELEDASVLDLWIRTAETEAIPVLPIPLCGVAEVPARPRDGAAFAAARERLPAARWSREFPEVPKESREAVAREAVCLALLRGGEPFAAREAIGDTSQGSALLVQALAAFEEGAANELTDLARRARDDQDGLLVRALAARAREHYVEAERLVRVALAQHQDEALARRLALAFAIEDGSVAAQSFARWREVEPAPAGRLGALLALIPAPHRRGAEED